MVILKPFRSGVLVERRLPRFWSPARRPAEHRYEVRGIRIAEMITTVWRRLVAGLFLLWAFGATAQTNGIFADFTTSLGNFTCQLSYSNSPVAVANFVGLATGQRAWLDLNTGEARTNAFYDGLTFHRVVAGFMIQGGSPNGLGTDGPGYAFADQFNPQLNFDGPWILAMANSGTNSNGSQFFVTVAPFTPGNNNYVIFGRVVAGTNVVTAISQVATNANSKPLTNVVIEQVAIRRVGTAAQSFDVNAYGLPLVTNIPLQPGEVGQRFSLTFSNRLYADNRLYVATNLNQWTANELGIQVTPPNSNSVPVAMDAPAKFFRFAQVQYASSTFAPQDVFGKKLVMRLTSTQTNTIVFDARGGGTYNLTGIGSGTVAGYSWSQDVYRGYLWPIQYSGLYPMTLELDFTSPNGGWFKGTYYSAPQVYIGGPFTLTP